MPDMKRDFRYNSTSGRAHEEPDSKATGAALVARVMRGQDTAPNARTPDHAQKFDIGDKNLAKKIDHDAAPR